MDNTTLRNHYRTIVFGAGQPPLNAMVPQYEATYSPLLPGDLNARILDVGCGMGHFLYFLKQKGYQNIVGIDRSPEQVEYCRNSAGVEVCLVDDLVSFLGASRDGWDCITMIDVIEHLPRKEVVPVLAAIFDALRNGGSLIVETGNMAAATGVYLLYNDFTHECGFTESSLRQVFRAGGFTEIRIFSPPPIIYSWRSRVRLLAEKLWQHCLRLIYRLEGRWDSPPRLLSKLLIAHASKHPLK